MPAVSKRSRKPLLSASHPHLFKQLDSKKNEDINLSKLTGGSSKRPIWTCEECSHEWEAQVNNRAYYNTGCPNCNSKSSVYIRDAYPELYEELTVPDPTLFISHRENVSWTCSKCGHQWEARVDNRAYNKSGCPECSQKYAGTSKLEKRFYEVVKNHPDTTDVKHGIKVDQKFKSGRKMTVDISFVHVPTGNLVYLEIDGKRWHQDEAQINNDTYKTKTLLETSNAFVIRTRNDGLAFLEIEHERLIQVDFRWTTQEGPIVSLLDTVLTSFHCM